MKVKAPGVMNDIWFSMKTGSPREIVYDVVNFQGVEGWVEVG